MSGNEKLETILFSVTTEENWDVFINLYHNELIDKENFIKKYIAFAVKGYNSFLLYKFYQLDNSAFGCEKDKLPADDKEKCEKLLSVNNEDRSRISRYMQQFVKGFGNILYDGGAITFAALRARKEYDFRPTLIYLFEFNDYLILLNQLARKGLPVREKFVIADGHWQVGEIFIDKDNKAHLVFIDSLGKKAFFGMKGVLVCRLFNSYFPNSIIYYSEEKRLNSRMGCSVFSIDDVRYLYVCEKFLSVEHNGNIFNYLEKQKNLDREVYCGENGPYEVHFCHLPLGFNRTMQSTKLFSEVIPGRTEQEQELSVNNKGQTASISSKLTIQNNNGKVVNTRLDKKLEKIAADNFQYLLSKPLHQIEKEMNFFTLEEFKNHIEFGPELLENPSSDEEKSSKKML